MAIDGRTLVEKPADDSAKAYESRGLAVVAQLIIWVPLALFAAFTYWSGTFFGGTLGGVLSLVSTVGTILGLWAWKRMRRRG